MSETPMHIRAFSGLDLAAVHRLAGSLGDAVRAALSEDCAPASITVGLTGDLGAGKTTFAQAFVAALPRGSSCRVTSPTYAIIQVYETRPPVRHVDLYRIDSADQLDAIGYGEQLYAPGINLVEWIRSVPEALPREWLEVELVAGSDEQRAIRMQVYGARLVSLLTKVSTK